MKTKSKVALLIGIAVATIGGVVLYKRNLRRITKSEEAERSEFEKLGIDTEVLNKDAERIAKKSGDYGDIRRFSDLPFPQQLVRLLVCSDNWSHEELDWETAVFSDKGAYNSVHVVFKEHKEEYFGTDIGFFLEVPPLFGSQGNALKYRDYLNFLNNLAQDFWAKERVECARPRNTEVIGLYSRQVDISKETSGKIQNVLQYTKIPDEVLIKRSRYSDRLDGLYSYYTDAKREAERGVFIVPEEIDDIHLFMGVWFRLETPSKSYGGMTMSQVLKFLEELILRDNYVIEDVNHKNQQKLGPVIVHPSSELELILDHDLSVRPIEFG